MWLWDDADVPTTNMATTTLVAFSWLNLKMGGGGHVANSDSVVANLEIRTV